MLHSIVSAEAKNKVTANSQCTKSHYERRTGQALPPDFNNYRAGNNLWPGFTPYNPSPTTHHSGELQEFSPTRPIPAALPLQRKCDCGGSCSDCSAKAKEEPENHNEIAPQTKLNISQPGDVYEREADWMADQVMQHFSDPVSPVNKIPTTNQDRPIQRLYFPGSPGLFRQTTDEEEGQSTSQDVTDFEQPEDLEGDDTAQEGEEEDENIVADETGMPKRQEGAANLSRPTPRGQQKVTIPAGPGQPLQPGIRHFMEQSFGYNFGDVRVHTDKAAVESSQQLQALAYTVRNNIYFNTGRYAPDKREGQKLLAHELSHVVQQSLGEPFPGQMVQRAKGGTSKGGKKGGGKSSSPSGCPQGKQSKVVHDDCGTSGPADENKYIKELNVSISNQTVEVIWSGGVSETWDCSPRPGVTPLGSDVVGTKCSEKHTNIHKDGMAWFTGFKSEGLRIGFHDSQRVGKGIFSHGCVRVSCDHARTINKNSWSGKTKINVTK